MSDTLNESLNKWCSSCKHHDKKYFEDPCWDCIRKSHDCEDEGPLKYENDIFGGNKE